MKKVISGIFICLILLIAGCSAEEEAKGSKEATTKSNETVEKKEGPTEEEIAEEKRNLMAKSLIGHWREESFSNSEYYISEDQFAIADGMVNLKVGIYGPYRIDDIDIETDTITITPINREGRDGASRSFRFIHGVENRTQLEQTLLDNGNKTTWTFVDNQKEPAPEQLITE